MTDNAPIAVGTRVSFPYGGSRRTGTVADVSMIPDQSGGKSLAYLIDVGTRKVFVQGEGITPATGPGQPSTLWPKGSHTAASGRGTRATDKDRHTEPRRSYVTASERNARYSVRDGF